MDGLSIRLTYIMHFCMATFQWWSMSQPLGFAHPQFPNHLCKLQKALYGLKQAPRAWFSKLIGKLQTLRFKASQSDTSLFLYQSATCTILVLIYVDDIFITSSSSSAVRDLLSTLKQEFVVKDLGLLNYFLGIEVLPSSGGFLLSQHRYTQVFRFYRI
jgi:hypothetical protein